MKRFYFSFDEFETGSFLTVSVLYHKIINVLRMSLKEEVLLYNGRGKKLICVISSIDRKKKSLIVKILHEEKESGSSIKIILIQSLIKKAKLEIAVQKAVELGVDKIFLLSTERTVAHCSELNLERINSIAAEACSQCGRNVIPIVMQPVDWTELKNLEEGTLKFAGSLKGHSFRIEDFSSIKPGDGDAFQLIVGPEGGFTEKEETELSVLGYKLIRLNKYTLRSETAAINMLSIFSYLRDIYLT